MVIVYAFLVLVVSYLGFSVLFLFLLALAGRLGKADDVPTSYTSKKLRKIAVLIPAYKEDAVLVDSVLTNLKQDYPESCFDLVVIADSLQPYTIERLAGLRVIVIPVVFEVSTVTKAINAALTALPLNFYDVIVVSDADNCLSSDFLTRTNNAFDLGWKAVQGHRVAKNSNTSVAVLDAVSEEINNHLFRKGYRALNLSSSIIGSGMAIEFSLMKKVMSDLLTVGGYDKEIEMKIVLHGHTVGYLEQAMIYDEKVSKREIFEKQRTRWIAAQWQFLVNYFRIGFSELLKGNIKSFTKVIQALILPRVLLLGILPVVVIIGLLTEKSILWKLPLILLIMLCFVFLVSIPTYLWKKITFRELFMIPLLMINFIRAAFGIKKAFKSFIHTPHTADNTIPGNSTGSALNQSIYSKNKDDRLKNIK